MSELSVRVDSLASFFMQSFTPEMIEAKTSSTMTAINVCSSESRVLKASRENGYVR